MGLFSAIGGALGLTGNTAGDGFRQSQTALLGQIGNSAAQYGQLANSAAGAYGNDNGAYRSALGNQEDALGQGFSNADRSSYINSQTANVGAAYQQGQAGLTSSLAARGLGNSGSMAGGLADLANSRSGAYATAANNANNYFSNAQLQRDAQLTGLTSGAANQDYGRQMNAMGAENGLNQYAAGQYGNLATQAYQEQAQQNGALFSNLGSIAGGIGNLFGRSSANGSLYGGSGGGGSAAAPVKG